jgi:hypothetical protein
MPLGGTMIVNQAIKYIQSHGVQIRIGADGGLEVLDESSQVTPDGFIYYSQWIALPLSLGAIRDFLGY